MPEGRPAIPEPLKRRVLVESGHRCAIPTCRSVPVEIAHIDPWSKVQEHQFSNLIALCPTCHSRYDRGDIDRQSMLAYKANLALLNARYGDLERRLLEEFSGIPEEGFSFDTPPSAYLVGISRFDTSDPRAVGIGLPVSLQLAVAYLLKDGLIEEMSSVGDVVPDPRDLARDQVVYFKLTEAGREFVRHMAAADPLA